MPITLDGETQNILRPLDDYPTPFARYIGAKFGQQMSDNPTMMAITDPSFGDALAASNAMLGAVESGYVPPAPAVDPDPIPHVYAISARQRVLAAHVALDIPDDGIAAPALDALIQRQQERIAREQAIAGSPTGGRSVLGFGASLAAGLLDPLNIGAAFVPVVGPARYAAMLETAVGAVGRAGVRMGVGALEGAAGTALLEPVTMGLHHALGDDYTSADSLLNIAFGTIMGGGLHAGAGALGDLLNRAGPEVRNEALKTAIGQANAGEHINVEPILRPESSDINAAARAQGSTTNIVGADMEASRAADVIAHDGVTGAAERAGDPLSADTPATSGRRLDRVDPRLQAAHDELDAALARLADVRGRNVETPDQTARIEAEALPHQVAIADSEGMARAARAAALCMTGG